MHVFELPLPTLILFSAMHLRFLEGIAVLGPRSLELFELLEEEQCILLIDPLCRIE